jgi:hypothetical protein
MRQYVEVYKASIRYLIYGCGISETGQKLCMRRGDERSKHEISAAVDHIRLDIRFRLLSVS